MQMADKGFSKGWGGTARPGIKLFSLCRDPCGSYSEYLADTDYISVNHDWQGGDYPPEDSLYLWGPDIPADFVHNHEVDI